MQYKETEQPESATNFDRSKQADIAVLIPCYNEGKTIAAVVKSFAQQLPTAKIYVYDNNSTDETARIAYDTGAIVYREPQQGKGNVVRRMFADVDADIYVLVDGDDTYNAKTAAEMIERLYSESLDMVSGCRVTDIKAAYRTGHRFGNKLLTGLVTTIFGKRTTDMLSGYRVFSRRFVKSFPALSRGFEIETELTVHALELRMPIADVETHYRDRAPGSSSKLNTVRDGIRIVYTIFLLIKEERPLQLFGLTSIALALLSVGIGYPLIEEFLETGLVPRFPTAVLSAAIMILAVTSFFSGLILDSITHGRREMKRLAYLRFPAPTEGIHLARMPVVPESEKASTSA